MGGGVRTIDSDGHVLEPTTLWHDYIDPKFREKAPKFIFTEEGGELFWLSDEYSLGSGKSKLGSAGLMAMREEDLDFTLFKANVNGPGYEEATAGGFDPHKRIVDMNKEGIDAVFLYPTLGLFLDVVKDPIQSTANYRAYNRWLAEYAATHPDRLFGVAALPLQSVEAAVAELRHCVREYGFKAAFIRPNPYNGRPLHHPDFYPLWAEAQDLDVAIGIHGGAAVPNLGADRFPARQGHAVEHCVVHTFEMMAASASFIMCGVCERFPKLRVAFLEAGGGWMLGWLDRMDRHYVDRAMNDTILTALPSDIFRRQCFVSFEPVEQGLKVVAEALGPTNILWASDYPHPDGFWGAVRMIKKMGLDPAVEQAVLCEGAQRFYNLQQSS